MPYNRRQFLKKAGQAAAAASCLAPLARGEPAGSREVASGRVPQLPIVDTHQHLWDLDKFRLPWLKSAGSLNRSFLPKDYLEAVHGLPVTQAVYMEVDADPAQRAAEAEYVLDLCCRRELPTRAAVIGGCPGEEGFRQYVRRFQGSAHVKGVRQVLFRGPAAGSFSADKKFLGDVRFLGELGMSFDLCLAAAALDAGTRLIDQCPGTQFILDHCGNADVKVFQAAAAKDSRETARQQVEQWRRDIARLAQCKNAVCKISGIIASVPREGWSPDDLAPIVNHCLACFGPDRVMFGSDWPVCTRGATLRRWVEVLLELVRPRNEAEQRKLFAANALRVYRLEANPQQ
jgi:L-fuconolactonase